MKQLNKIIEEALIKNNVLAKGSLKTYQEQAQKKGESLRDFLIDQNIVTEQQILVSLCQQLNLERVSFQTLAIDSAAIEKVPVKFVWYYKIMPIRLEGDTLTVASAIPLDVKTQDELRVHLGSGIKVVLASERELTEALKKYYGFASDTIDRIMTKEGTSTAGMMSSMEAIEDIEQKSEDPTVSNLVNEIIMEAYRKRATDIHIEPYRDKVRFRYRIDGVLVDAYLPDKVKHFLPAILSRIKIMANLSITERRLPQDGSAVVKTREQPLDLRISTMPTPRGESLVVRILPSKVMLFSLEKLGFNEEGVKSFRELIKRPHGIIFLTGPTGSGKTTTLYACLNEISTPGKKIITIEDPVEYEMEGITQVQVNPKVQFSFATGLRSILRHDPDIIMVGEVRDPETAEIAIKTALTGHLVFSTLHTNDASSGVTRLIDMGIEPYLVASSVEAFVAQRLVRVICPRCKEEDAHPLAGIVDEIRHSLKFDANRPVRIYKGKGCEYCNGTGYYGRVAIYENLMLNDRIRAAILEKPRSDYIKKIAIEEGMQTLRQNGWQAVLQGITTYEEVMNVTTKDDALGAGNLTDKLKKDDAEQTQASLRQVKIKKQGNWSEKNDYDGRMYERSYDPISVRYRLVKKDEQNHDTLVTDGIEHSTVTEDISAGGLRFTCKQLIGVGSILELNIQAGEAGKSIDCFSKVCRVEQDNFDNAYTIVAYYLDISSADRVLIDRLVKKKANKGIEVKENVS
ncbi:MAG TPA: ATPase, T2SS/T4P/T4SS family [Candidatus Omnitrophota bacterium]|nr:ATPase, T2SS/T4P/T4SS family [Candidatus Omnitrophota bacterium]